MDLVKLSLEIATKYHAGQTRWDKNIPYINHPIKVSEIAAEIYPKFYGNCDSLDKLIVKCVGLLHGVLEDCNVTHEQLYLELVDGECDYNNQRIALAIIENVRAITKNPEKLVETYLEYILRVKSLPYSRIVKIADITHNSSDLKPGSMKDKYSLAKYILEN